MKGRSCDDRLPKGLNGKQKYRFVAPPNCRTTEPNGRAPSIFLSKSDSGEVRSSWFHPIALHATRGLDPLRRLGLDHLRGTERQGDQGLVECFSGSSEHVLRHTCMR